VLQARRWLPGRELVVVGDSAFAALEFLAAVGRHKVTCVTRLRLDAALYDPASPRRPGTNGRPRTKGRRLANLSEVLRSHRIEAFRDAVSCAIEAHKDITLAELVALLRREHGVSFAISTVHRHLVRHQITLKKAAHAAEQDRPDVARRRQAWFDAQPDLDPACLVFIDEAGRPPKWRGCGAEHRVGSAAGRPCRTDTGKQRPLWVRCALAA